MARQEAEDILWKPFLQEQIGHYKDEKELVIKVEKYLKERMEKDKE